MTTETEADRLWKHVLVGTSTCISMIGQYQSLGMPNMPIEGVTQLRDALNTILEKS